MPPCERPGGVPRSAGSSDTGRQWPRSLTSVVVDRFVFEGGVAVVTGAASGIGEGLAFGLAKRGCHLALIDKDAVGLGRVAKRIVEQHPALTVRSYVADLAHTEGLATLADEVMADF